MHTNDDNSHTIIKVILISLVRRGPNLLENLKIIKL